VLESQHGDFRSSKLNSLKSGSHTLKYVFFGSQLRMKGTKQFQVSQDLCSQITDPAISPGQKWGWTVLEIQISYRQWEGSACTRDDGPWFFLSGGLGGVGFFVFHPCSISPPAITLGQKWWPTVLETKNTCNQWGRLKHALKVPWFYFILSFGLWGSAGRNFSIFPLFPTCSFQVPIRFPICSLSSQCVPQGCYR